MALTLDGDNGISGINGSATTPAVQGTDTNTGLTFGTDTVGIVTGGTTRATVDSSGRLGIGVTDPAEELEVSGSGGSRIALNRSGNDGYAYIGTGTTNDLHFGYDGSGSLEFGRFDSSGRLLINGTTSQTWSGGAPLVQVSGTSASGTMHFGAFQYSDSSDGGELVLGSSRGTTVGSTTIVQNNDTLGRIRFCAADGNDLTNRGGEITCAIDGTPGSDDIPTRMMFFTASDGAGSPTERVRIESNGNFQFKNVNSAVFPATDNSYTLGANGVRWSAVWAANGSIQTSDEREKTEITDSVLGTDFIKSLRPVSYKWINGGNVDTGERDEDNNYIYASSPGKRRHWGFLAQEVKQSADAAGVDFGGWLLTDKDDPDSEQALRYDQFIAPLTKALQEALAKIETLETANASLEARLTALEGGAA